MRSTQLTIEFSNPQLLNLFTTWLSDGGGEQGFMQCFQIYSAKQNEYVRFDYSKCFPTWGYDPQKHGDPTIKVELGVEVP